MRNTLINQFCTQGDYYAVCTYRSGQRKNPRVSRHCADIVYEGIVGVLKAPDGDRFMIIGEHAPENFVYDPNFLDISERLTSLHPSDQHRRKHQGAEACLLPADGRRTESAAQGAAGRTSSSTGLRRPRRLVIRNGEPW